MSVVEGCLQNIPALLGKCVDDALLEKAFGVVLGCIANADKHMDSLASFPEGDYALKQKCRNIVFQVRLVLLSLLEESKDLKALRLVCLDCLHAISSEINFRNMKIEDFLKEEELEKYTELFTDEEIIKPCELLDAEIINIDELSDKMKPASLERLKERLRKAVNVERHIGSQMMTDLERASVSCNETSEAVTRKLNQAITDLQREAAVLVRSINDGKRRAEIRKLVFQVISVTSQIVVWYSLTGMGSALFEDAATAFADVARGVPRAMAGYQLGQFASGGIESADSDLEVIDQLLQNFQSETNQMDNQLKKSVMNWQIVMVTFTDLLGALKKSGKMLEAEELHDVNAHITHTRKALKTLDNQIEEFEEKIKKSLQI